MVAPSIQVAELDASQLFEYLTNVLRACLPECVVGPVQVVGKPDPVTGEPKEWFLVGTATRKINLAHTRKFSVPFNPTEEWSDKKLDALMQRLVPAIRQAFRTNQTVKFK